MIRQLAEELCNRCDEHPEIDTPLEAQCGAAEAKTQTALP
jgi:hypothetical protein